MSDELTVERRDGKLWVQWRHYDGGLNCEYEAANMGAALAEAIERRDKEIEFLRKEMVCWEAVGRESLSLKIERDECRRLLREAVAWMGDVRTNDDAVMEWYEAARKVAGGDDE